MANPNPKIENLKPCKPGETANPNGRPKKFITLILDDLESKGYKPISKTQVAELYQRILVLDEGKLKELVDNKDAPMIVRILAKAILGHKGFEIIEKMLDRSQGKAVEFNANLNMNVNQNDPFNVVINEMRDEIIKAREVKSEARTKQSKKG